MTSATITIRLNGADRQLTAGLTVTALLSELGLGSQPVLVELNGKALFPREFAATILASNDSVEVIRIVAGG